MGFKAWLQYHFQENSRFYLVGSAFFIVGIALGAAVLRFLSAEQLSELAGYLDLSLSGLTGTPIDQTVIIQRALGQNLYFLLLIAFLGLTVIGVPLVLGLIGLRGFMLGFTVGFLITEKAGAGILLAAVGVLPQNLFYVPAFIITGSQAVLFSLRLVKGRQGLFGRSLWGYLFGYIIAVAGMLVLVGIGGLVESYLTPAGIRWLIAYLSQ